MSLLETLAAPETLPSICRAWFEAAADAGLDALGFAPFGRASTFEIFAERVRRGDCAGLPYLEENLEARRDPRSVLPSAQTLVVVALSERRLRAESTAAELAQIAAVPQSSALRSTAPTAQTAPPSQASQTIKTANAAQTVKIPQTGETPRSSGTVVPYAA
ncbi:MAG: hypothetical protein IJO46_00250, partial [Thermoguttaceae bacterium]|nr:hypothetical protein [Thermoguttaceae bacterium]